MHANPVRAKVIVRVCGCCSSVLIADGWLRREGGRRARRQRRSKDKTLRTFRSGR